MKAMERYKESKGRVRYLSGAEEERLRAVCSPELWDAMI